MPVVVVVVAMVMKLLVVEAMPVVVAAVMVVAMPVVVVVMVAIVVVVTAAAEMVAAVVVAVIVVVTMAVVVVVVVARKAIVKYNNVPKSQTLMLAHIPKPQTHACLYPQILTSDMALCYFSLIVYPQAPQGFQFWQWKSLLQSHRVTGKRIQGYSKALIGQVLEDMPYVKDLLGNPHNGVTNLELLRD
ncbi:hypothetical protein E2542_SST05123 [Spatholobus suberectus]|nr:hypothetical protein E2542_SST05123 [Spatholobus suberectus]